MSNIEKIRQEIERLKNIAENNNASEYLRGQARVCRVLLAFIDSLSEEKPSEYFPTSDEEMAKFLATHPKVEVPEKYKTPNWLFDKQPSEDLEEAANDSWVLYEYRETPQGLYSSCYIDGFIAGAKWQKEQAR